MPVGCVERSDAAPPLAGPGCPARVADTRQLGKANDPIPTAEIVTAILAAGGHGESARLTVAPRVRTNLAYLQRRDKVIKTGDGRTARWTLI